MALAAVGVALIFLPAGLIVAGAMVVAVGWLEGRETPARPLTLEELMSELEAVTRRQQEEAAARAAQGTT